MSVTEPTEHMAEPTAAERVAAGPMRMLELFAAICGAPDDERLAAQADQELAELDALVPHG